MRKLYELFATNAPGFVPMFGEVKGNLYHSRGKGSKCAGYLQMGLFFRSKFFESKLFN